MASNFAFYPQSVTNAFTVGASTITFSMTLNLSGGTGTLGLTSGNYQVSGARLANTGTSHVQVLFSSSGSPTLTSTNGMPVLSGTVETFRCQGLTYIQMLCLAGSTTVWITCGEGL